MKHRTLIICFAVALLYTVLVMAYAPDLRSAPNAVAIWCAFFGVITFGLWLLTLAFRALCGLIDLCQFLAAAFRDDDEEDERREFSEPQRDTVIESDDLGPVLIECDTAGEPTPPAEVMVHRYQWNAALSAYEYAGCETLSQYALLEADPAIEQVLSRGPQPPVWEHAQVFPRPRNDLTNHGAPLNGHDLSAEATAKADSEFDDIERNLQAPGQPPRVSAGDAF